jgi:hypothetical protein
LSYAFFEATFSTEKLSPKDAVCHDPVNGECQKAWTDDNHEKCFPTLSQFAVFEYFQCFGEPSTFLALPYRKIV